jgi:hypothetical protein
LQTNRCGARNAARYVDVGAKETDLPLLDAMRQKSN